MAPAVPRCCESDRRLPATPRLKGNRMHPQQLIDTVVQLEKDLAAFYRRLEKEDRLQKLHKIFQFMNQHSDIHAEMIRNLRAQAGLPVLDLGPLEILHEKIKSALVNQLTAAEELDDVYDQLAQTEAIISKVYTTISGHYQKMADVYSLLSQQFKNLADDEMRHHDHIQEEKELSNESDDSQETADESSG